MPGDRACRAPAFDEAVATRRSDGRALSADSDSRGSRLSVRRTRGELRSERICMSPFSPDAMIPTALGLVLLSPLSTIAQPVTVEAIREADELALGGRRALRSYEVVIRTSRQAANEPPQTDDSTVERHYLVDGRKTLVWRRHHSPGRKAATFVSCKNCVADGYYMDFVDFEGQKTAAAFSPMRDFAPANVAWRRISDPLLIGFVRQDYHLSPQAPLDSMVGRAGRDGLTGRREKLGSLNTIRVEYRAGERGKVAYWLAPSHGHSVVRVESSTEDFRVITTLTPRRFPDSGLWFPEAFEISDYQSGKLTETRRSTVEVLSLNQPIPASRFEVPAMRLPAGTVVAEIPPGRKTMVWDGESLVDYDYFNASPNGQLEPGWGRRRWAGRAAIALAAVAGILFLQYLLVRHRRNGMAPKGSGAPGEVPN